MDPEVIYFLQWLAFAILCRVFAYYGNYRTKIGQLVGAYLDILWVFAVSFIYVLLLINPF